MSTMQAADEMRDDLREYQAKFWVESRDAGARDPGGAYVIGNADDPARAYYLLDILLRHEVEVYELAEKVEVDDESFEPGAAYVIPLNQRQYRLVRAVMEYRTSFEDETFYDVSTWTLPSSFHLPHAELGKRFKGKLLGERISAATFPAGSFRADPEAVAYAFEWRGYHAPRALQRLLAGRFRPYAATKPTTVPTPEGTVDLARGSILIPLGLQIHRMPASPGTTAAQQPPIDRRAEVEEVLQRIAELDGLTIHSVTSGMTPKGADLGSPTMRPLQPVRPLLVVGSGVSGYEAGEVWHLLDTRVDLPLTMVDADRLLSVDLAEYTHILLVDGSYKSWSRSWTPRLESWIKSGGVLVATKRGAEWATEQQLHTAKKTEPAAEGKDDADKGKDDADKGKDDAAKGKKSKKGKTGESPEDGEAQDEGEEPEGEESEEETYRPYGDFLDDRARRVVGGSIFRTTIDTTHPLGYGYRDASLPVFRNSTLLLKRSENPYSTVGRYENEPLLSGYASAERQEEIAGTASIVATRHGRGAVIRIVDNPNFRGVWYGTNKLYLNAIFFGQLIDNTNLD